MSFKESSLFRGLHLLATRGCGDAGWIYIHADTDQRTLETGRALAEALLPGCAAAVHSEPEGVFGLYPFSPEGASGMFHTL